MQISKTTMAFVTILVVLAKNSLPFEMPVGCTAQLRYPSFETTKERLSHQIKWNSILEKMESEVRYTKRWAAI